VSAQIQLGNMELSILTHACPYNGRLFSIAEIIENLVRRMLGMPSIEASLYKGHPAVVRSLLRGLQQAGINAQFNPKSALDITGVCHVLSGLDALEQAIKLKASGRIVKLVVGPNVVVAPSDCRKYISSPYIDLYLVNSKWTYDMYIKDEPLLADKCSIWPSGVDETYWNYSGCNAEKEQIVLIYIKSKISGDILNAVTDLLEFKGWGVEIVTYGEYTLEEYREKLFKAKFAIFFSDFESQGIALVESWSCGVPTLVWNPGSFRYIARDGTEIVCATSSAPYLNDDTGFFFASFKDFEELIIERIDTILGLTPRNWVLANMSDRVSVEKYLELIGPKLEKNIQ